MMMYRTLGKMGTSRATKDVANRMVVCRACLSKDWGVRVCVSWYEVFGRSGVRSVVFELGRSTASGFLGRTESLRDERKSAAEAS